MREIESCISFKIDDDNHDNHDKCAEDSLKRLVRFDYTLVLRRLKALLLVLKRR